MALFSDRAEILARLRRVERKLDLALAALDVQDAEPDQAEEYRNLLAAGRKIEAIKLYRERTGTGLYEAKQAIDEIHLTMRAA